METTVTKKKFIRLRSQGNSFDKIAKKLKISKATLIDWSREFAEEISNLKSLELEALYEEMFLTVEHRLRTLGKVIKRLEQELIARDYRELQTDKLVDLYLRVHGAAKAEMIEPKFFNTKEIANEKMFNSRIEDMISQLSNETDLDK